MKMPPRSPRSGKRKGVKMSGSRIIRAGLPLIAVLALVALYNYGFVALKGRLDAFKDDRFVTEKALGKYKAFLARVPEMQKRLDEMKRRRRAEELKLIPGKTAALAGASLQERVRGIITDNGGVIRTERITKSEQKGSFMVIGASIDATLPDTEALANVLYGIETRTPYMLIDSLDVRTKNARNPVELIVKLGVSGLSVLQ